MTAENIHDHVTASGSDVKDRRAQFADMVSHDLAAAAEPAGTRTSPVTVTETPVPVAPVITNSGPRGYTRPDMLILDDLARCLAENQLIEAADVEIGCSDGVVTFTGTVPRRDDQSMLEALALTTFGVIDVAVSGLKIRRNLDAPDHDTLVEMSKGTSHELTPSVTTSDTSTDAEGGEHGGH